MLQMGLSKVASSKLGHEFQNSSFPTSTLAPFTTFEFNTPASLLELYFYLLSSSCLECSLHFTRPGDVVLSLQALDKPLFSQGSEPSSPPTCPSWLPFSAPIH